MQPRTTRWFVVTFLAAVALLTMTACGSQPATGTPARTEIVGREMSFTPALVTATVGQPITMAFVNEGVVEHDWVVLNLPARDVRETVGGAGSTHQAHAGNGATPSVHVAALPGQRGEVIFTAERPGRYTIVCTVPGHKEAGMMGMLTVVG